MSNKRSAISGEVIWFIPQMLFLIAVLFAFVILIKSLIVVNIDVREVDSTILVHRLLLSQDGISYYDGDLGRLHPGIIDLEKFREISDEAPPNILDNEIVSYGSDNPIIAASIALKQKGMGDIVVFYNKEKYDRWEPRVGIKKGPGSVKSFTEKKYVLVNDNGILSPGVLNFFIIS